MALYITPTTHPGKIEDTQIILTSPKYSSTSPIQKNLFSITMTGVKKDSHQKRRITRSQYNRDNAFVNLQPTFDEAIAVDTATVTLVPIIDVDCDDSDDDGHDDGDGEDDSYHPPDSGDSSTPSKITTAPICDIVLYPETNSAVTATTLALASEQHPNSISNITKNIKKKERDFFHFS